MLNVKRPDNPAKRKSGATSVGIEAPLFAFLKPSRMSLNIEFNYSKYVSLKLTRYNHG